MQEMATSDQPEDRLRLLEPHSCMRESLNAHLQAAGLISSHRDTKVQMGYQAPEHQGAVAVETLKAFLGLELPIALNFTDWGRSTHRMSAVHAYLSECYQQHYLTPDLLNVCWTFNGYQLYASHQIGTAHFRRIDTQDRDHIERRLLDGQWVRWGFDGPSTLPAGRKWSSSGRIFFLAASGIQRINQSDSDLRVEYHDQEFDDDAKDGMPPSQETM